MSKYFPTVVGGICLAYLGCAGAASAENEVVGPKSPKPDCAADVRWDQNQKAWPGYFVDDPDGRHCVPFTATVRFPPADYKGDYYVDEFTDAKIREAWADCVKKGPECSDPVRKAAKNFIGVPPFAMTGKVDAFGKIDPNGDVKLTDIRRPKYFGAAPYNEKIAAVDGRTWVVEVEVPSERTERETLGVDPSQKWKLRGWYIEGAGVENGRGEKTHPLVIIIGGRTIETTALHEAKDPLWVFNAEKGAYAAAAYPNPNTTTEKWGLTYWRETLNKFNLAGFDVLTFDKRGHGISGGKDTANTVEEARDLFRAVDAFETGKGLRVLGPDGKELSGKDAAGKLMAGQKAKEVPLIVAGPSQASMVTGHAMHLNFVCDRAFEEANEPCGAPMGYNVKGAIALAEFVHAVGYTPRVLTEGLMRTEYHVPYVPSGEILGGVSKWPALFIGRGLWDFAGGLEGALDVYNRVSGPKEFVVVRGPHSENEPGPENVAHVQDRMTAFAKAVIHGDKEIPGAARFNDLKELVATSPAYWEESMRPAAK